MSLRREIHSTFDAIAPPVGGMPERVVQTVLSDARRRRKGRLMGRLRAPLSLVAVIVVVAVIAAVLVGGRMIADLNGRFNSAPAGQTRADGGTPRGGPVPVQLRGDWLMLASEAKAFAGPLCPDPLTVQTCTFKLTFTATTYYVDTKIAGFSGGGGDVVVIGTELDFFNAHACGQLGPAAVVGRYTWTVSAQGALSFAALNDDTCPRRSWLNGQIYTRTGLPPT